MPMIATTIISPIRVKPFCSCLRIFLSAAPVSMVGLGADFVDSGDQLQAPCHRPRSASSGRRTVAGPEDRDVRHAPGAAGLGRLPDGSAADAPAEQFLTEIVTRKLTR